MGFKRPTDIQFKAMPSILHGEDVMAIAQTGTGKTAAFVIPVIQLLLQQRNASSADTIRCVIMVPTRELALQIGDVCRQLAKHTQLEILTTIGGVNQEDQIDELAFGIDILVATPGRMFDLHHQGHIDLSTVQILILDEADQMLALGFLKDIQDVVKLIPRKHQTLFFSATINPAIKKLAYSLVHKPIRIQISPKDPVSKNVFHSVAMISMDDKRFFLERIIREHPQQRILVFVRTKVRAERVQKAMERVGIQTIVMHGGIEQHNRLSVLEQFKTGTCHILIATDISARGIDIPNVQYVINYDLPDVPENYVHRVGRTGRGMQKGEAISFCAPEEKELLRHIEDFMQIPVEVMPIDQATYSMTKLLAEKDENNWQQLLDDAAKEEAIFRSKKGLKKKK